MVKVRVLEPERMSLPGLMLQGILERARAAPSSRLRGEVLVDADGAQVTLRFSDQLVEITRAPAVRPVAVVRGTLRALLDAALGRGRVRAWLAGRLRVRGGPLTLLRLLGALRV
ncbi:MAG: hypothetical protein IT370_08655 [Deltaproteobacteria bacterium]|nr:hypothetical protein [Deltaproteobacteria bacterium]